MNKKSFLFGFIIIVSGLLITGTVALSAAEKGQSLVLFDFAGSFNIGSVITSDAEVTLSGSGALRIETGHKEPWPGITLKAPAGKWDLSQYEYVSLDVKNLGTKPVTVSCRVDNPDADGSKNCVSDSIKLNPQVAGTLVVRVFPTPWRLSEPVELIGMRGAPVHSGKVDASNITQLLLFCRKASYGVRKPSIDHVFEVKNIRAGGRVETLDVKTFFPFIDDFGQYIHKDWPGKTHSLKEMIAQGKAEDKDIAAHPGPTDRNKYGGWSAGPKLRATGFFRAEKYEGKWWLVDPQGRLFWSHGIDCVRSTNATPITDREHYYHNLPEADSRFAKFYGSGSWAPHGYYKDHSPYKTYDFSQANFLQKYGRDWENIFAEVTHRRLKSWGINTIANWSDSSIYLMRKTPYVCTISYSARSLEGSQGYWGKFYDVFDPSFRARLRERLALEKGRAIGDPWCIGYFVHNEIAWGDEVSLAVAALISPAEQPAKKVFVEDLKAKYGTIDKLNAAWGTKHPTWQALRQSQQAPDKKKARADLTAFYTRTAETYFSTIREELKKVAPNQLYMGCRFAWVNDRAARAATKFCDIVSYNRYSYSVREHRLPDGIDKPVIIGEFHFGALDRGMFHTGLKKTANQQDRADKYKSYVRGALQNPYIVGTHWFQYKDQATTGRGDGENYQIGFIDICDKPYPEIVRACREVGYDLYEYRLKDK
ncbi:MAG: beta-galactosidase [Planctomycetota bacterium]